MQQVDDPPYLSVGTEVSAKYKGAFCEAKVRKVARNIKCKVAYKQQGLGTGIVSDEQIKGVLRAGNAVEVRHPTSDKREYVEATIIKIQDGSQYTVVFDDGDITTLRRSALCLKSGRHFNESETLDQLPLTHPEHFGNPVIGGRRGRRSRQLPDDSSDEEPDHTTTRATVSDKEEHIGKVVCVESNDTKKKGPKENWFPGLVVAPTAQDTVRIRVKDEYLVRSFKDGRYYTVPKKEANEFTRDMTHKQDAVAVSAAIEYLDNDLLPPHWDREVLFGVSASSSEFEQDYESDSSDDEPTEEKDHFVAQLYKFMDDKGTPLNKGPSIINKDVDLYRLFRAVQKLGGYNRVTSQKQWKSIALRLGFKPATASITNLVRQAYKKFLHSFEEFNRKLGCTMVAHPRANRVKGRSMVRAGSVASPKLADLKEKLSSISSQNTNEESENTSESSSTETSKTKRKLSSSTSGGKVKSLVEKYEEKVKDSVTSVSSAASSAATSTAVSPTIPTTTSSLSTSTTTSATVSSSSSVKKERVIKKIDEKRGRKKKDSEPAAVEIKKEVAETLGPATAQSNIITTTSSSSISSSSSSSSQTAVNVGGSGQSAGNVKTPLPTTSNRQTTTTATEAQNFPIEVGDKLKVYYDEQKVTYEAKVIEIANQEGSPIYLVHYTGWNTRYDEWVRKDRIAENLTNTKSIKKLRGGKVAPARSSLSPASAISATPSGKNPKRLRGSSKGDSRSTTPLSSSRTKSPATPVHRRVTRGQPSSIIRRTSNNTDISSLQTDTDSDSDEPIKKLQTSLLNAAAQQTTPVKTEHPSERSESTTNTDEYLNGAKGRDYDLNQIRSELKGFKEMKSPSPETDVSTASTVGTSNIALESKSEESSGNSEKSTNLSSTMTNNTASELSASESLGSSEEDSNKASDIESIKNVKSAEKNAPLKAGSDKVRKSSFSNKLFGSIGSSEKGADGKAESKFPITKSTTSKDEESLADAGPKQVAKGQKTLLSKTEKTIGKEASAEKPKPVKVDKKQTYAEKMQNKKNLLEKSGAAKSFSAISANQNKLLTGGSDKTGKSNLYSDTKAALDTSTSDVYEFQDSEPFEFEASEVVEKRPKKQLRKQGPPIVATTTASSTAPFNDLLATTTTTAATATAPTAVTTTPNKRTKKSPLKDPEKQKPVRKGEKLSVGETVVTTSASLVSISGTAATTTTLSTSSTATLLTAPIISTATATPDAPSLLIPEKTRRGNDSTFDVLRKSPSFNMVNARDDVFASASATPSNVIVAPIAIKAKMEDKMEQQFSNNTSKSVFMNTNATDVCDPPKLYQKLMSKDNIAVPEPIASLETVKQMLIDPSFELDLPKSEKPSIADKVLKAISQQKQQEQQLAAAQQSSDKLDKSSDSLLMVATTATLASASGGTTVISTAPTAGPTTVISTAAVSAFSSTSLFIPTGFQSDAAANGKAGANTYQASLNKSLDRKVPVEATTTTTTVPLASLSVATTSSNTEPPKIEIPASIKKVLSATNGACQSTLQILTSEGKSPSGSIVKTKSILSSPEHKLDILDTISPKNNDLTETIQKLESVIMKTTPNINRFTEDSSDSTDSEQRLVIEDESQSSETNHPISNSEQGESMEKIDYEDLIKTELNIAKDKALIKMQPLAVNIDKFEKQPPSKMPEKTSILETIMMQSTIEQNKANNSKVIVEDVKLKEELLQNISASSSPSIKKEDAPPPIGGSNQMETIHNNESLSLLLCEETIPGSPAPPICGSSGTGFVINKESNCKEVPMDIETNETDNKTSGPLDSGVNNSISHIGGSNGGVNTSGGNVITSNVSGIGGSGGGSGMGNVITMVGTPDSSPRDSLSQDESKSDSEDLKKLSHSGISPKKRRRTRKSSECELQNKRRRGNYVRGMVTRNNNVSDSEDNSDSIMFSRAISASGKSPRPCQYNFLIQLDASLNSNQRISILRKKIQELRKTYNMIKTELASIDRRRKKLRRRERDNKKIAKMAAAVAASSTPTAANSSLPATVQVSSSSPGSLSAASAAILSSVVVTSVSSSSASLTANQANN